MMYSYEQWWSSLSQRQQQQLNTLYDLHSQATLNLTAIKNKAEFHTKHYLDSVYYFEANKLPYHNIIDIGSGGGFPGIPLAITNPQASVTLVESISKKCDFLRMAVATLKLENVTVIADRIENTTLKATDYITSRGVAPVNKMLTLTSDLWTPTTKMLLYKGERVEEELVLARKLMTKRGLNAHLQRVETPIQRTYCIINR